VRGLQTVADPALEQGGNINLVLRRDPTEDALCRSHARKIADFNLFRQLVSRRLGTILPCLIARSSTKQEGPLPGERPEPFVNYGWAQ
jgi:hypothetical protein